MKSIYLSDVKFESIPELTTASFDNVSFDGMEDPGYYLSDIRPISLDSEEFSFTAEVDAASLSKITGANHPRCCNYTVEFCHPYLVQKRRHKKWRINKKWAKRYGYKTMFKTVKIVDASIMRREEEYEIMGTPTQFIF